MPSIEEELKKDTLDDIPKSPQTQARAEVAARVFDLFDKARTSRDQSHELFRDRTLQQWIDMNVKRFIQFKRRPEHKKPWQSNLASTTPNEKLIGILSKLATQGMESKAITLREMDYAEMVKERIANAMLKAAAIKNDDDFQIILEMLEATEKGTVIGFEDWYHGKREIKDIIDQDPETGELKFKIKTIKEWNDVRSSLVNLEDFYPGNIYVRPGKVQDMGHCFLRTIMSEDEFMAEFGKYPDAEKVSTKSRCIANESTPFWRQSEDVADDQIEVLRYFEKETDEYVILANEIWINCKGKSEVSPLPWNHKKLPFWGGVFEPLDANFFYGRSLIDKLAPFCDAKDGLLDRILDQMTIAVSKPIVSDGSASSALTKGFIQPNNVITVDWTDGRPKFDVVPINDPPAAAFSLYQILQNNLEQTSISSEIIGGRSTKDKTATEVEAQQQGAMEIVSLFLKMMETAIRDKNRLRFANQLQFYSMPSNSKEKGERFRQIKLVNEKLYGDKQGVLMINVVKEPSQERVMERKRMIGQPAEVLEITPDVFRNMEMEIQIVPQSSIKMTDFQRQVLELNYQKVMNSMYQDLFNRSYGFDQLNLKFGKDPSQARAQKPMGAEMGRMGEEQQMEKKIQDYNLQLQAA